MSDAVTLALALLELEGVGRVTAGRLVKHFGSYAGLRRYPREQVLARLKGVPHAADLVAMLFDEEKMRPRLEAARSRAEALRSQRIVLLAPGDDGWPPALDDLPRALRPVLLYTYGDASLLARPAVALFARPPLAEPVFDTAQALVRRLCADGVTPAAGLAHGFDVVIHKIAATGPSPHPSLVVAGFGLARLAPPMRPMATTVVRAGGLLCSPFPMSHGPFPHDDRDRAHLLAGLARASVFFAPRPETPEWEALTWALDAGRPVFGLPHPDHPLPEAVHHLQGEVDFEWVTASTRV